MYICSIYEFVVDMKQWKHKKLSSIMVEVMVFFITELGMVIYDFRVKCHQETSFLALPKYNWCL